MSLSSSTAPAAETEHWDVSPDEVRVVQLRGWLARARARAKLIFLEHQHATAEVRRVEGELALVLRDLEGARMQ